MTTQTEPKTITPGERQAMLRLVKADYDQVRNEIEVARGAFLRQRYDEIDKQHADTIGRVAAYNRDAEKLRAKIQDQFEALWTKHLGVTSVERSRNKVELYYPSPPSEPMAVRKAKEAAREEAEMIVRAALSQLKRGEIEATKQLLRGAVVSEEAQAVMEALPKAETAFRAARASLMGGHWVPVSS